MYCGSMNTGSTVTVPLVCSRCSGGFEVDCAATGAVGRTGFYAIDCPHCAARLIPNLPGDVLAVRPDSRGDVAS